MSVTTRIRIAVFCLVATLGMGSSLAGEPVRATVVSDSGDRIVLQYTFGEYQSEAVNIEGREYLEISFPGEPVFLERGNPALPHVNRSVIIPDGDTEVRPHDRIVIFALADQVREVEHMFRVSLEYF